MKPNCLAGLLATLLCLGSVFSTQAAATGKCEYWSAGGYPRTEIFGLPTSVVLPAERYDWTIDGVGAGSANILASATVVPADDGRFPSHAAGPYDKPYLLCDSAAGNWTQEVLLEGFGPPIWATFPPIYESGVDGVGIRARSGFRGNWLPYIANYDRVSGVIDSQLWFYWTVQRFVVELVAIKKLPHTGTQELGMTRPGSVVINYKQGGAGPDLRPLTLLLSPIRILRGSCTVPDTTVEMGQIPLSSFDAVSYTHLTLPTTPYV